MKHLLHKAATLCFAIVIAVASVNLVGVAQVNAAPGNNGTLKVHEKGTPAGTESNDPKVCVFNFEGSNFDVAQSGYLVVTTQPGGVNSLVMPFGPADANGYAETQYVNDTGSPYTLANGSYKVTVYGKDTGNPALPNYLDEKAKSKNFKVECAAPTPLNATPVAPTRVDQCGTANDTYTLPATTGITYLVNGQPRVAGTYTGTGSVVITAVANNGYTIPANVTKQWTFNFSATPCIVTVTATAPTFKDICQTSNDTYTIPSVTGVYYRVNGVTKAPGTYSGKDTVIITAHAQTGYTLQGNAFWIEYFSDLDCVVVPARPTENDVCGRANDTYTIPATTGVRYYVNGVERGAGTYTATFPIIKITAVAKSGYVLDIREPFLWLFTYGDKRCPQPCHALASPSFFNGTPLVADPDCIPVQVTTTAPLAVDVCGTANDTYTIPATAGVVYRVNGTLTPAGTYPATGSVTITAHAADSGYVITNGQTTSWTFDFTDAACPRADIAVTAECNIDSVLVVLENRGNADGAVYVNGDKIDVVAGDTVARIVPTTLYKTALKVTTDASVVLLEQSYDCTPGQGAAGGPINRVTSLSQTVATPAPVTEFPQTGIGSWKQIYTGLILALITYGLTYYLQGRRKVTQE